MANGDLEADFGIESILALNGIKGDAMSFRRLLAVQANDHVDHSLAMKVHYRGFAQEGKSLEVEIGDMDLDLVRETILAVVTFLINVRGDGDEVATIWAHMKKNFLPRAEEQLVRMKQPEGRDPHWQDRHMRRKGNTKTVMFPSRKWDASLKVHSIAVTFSTTGFALTRSSVASIYVHAHAMEEVSEVCVSFPLFQCPRVLEYRQRFT